MPRWQETYDALAGERYPGLVAYASLYGGHRDHGDAADALVTRALKRTLARGRNFAPAPAVETEVRFAIARIVAEDAAREDTVEPRAGEPAAAASRERDLHAYAPSADALASTDRSPEPPPPMHLQLASALVDLDARTRAAMILHHLDGLPVRRVAEVTGLRGDDVAQRLAAGGDALTRRTGVSVAPVPADDALAGVEVTVTTTPARGGRRG